ncbi:MAG: ATP-binding protein [Candidatus Neomarinimicrobiota bacterium]
MSKTKSLSAGKSVKLKSISVKLLLLIVGLLLVGELVQIAISLRIHQNHLMTRMELHNSRLSEVILRSIYHGMLQNDKESIRRTIETIGQGKGVTTVRIYNKLGQIMVSTIPDEVDTQVDMAAEACDGCHIPGKPLPLQSEAHYARVYRQPSGARQLGIISPIKNELACSQPACHAHPGSSTVLGVLDVQVSLASVDLSLANETRQLLTLSTAIILLVIVLVGLFLWKTVHQPISRLLLGTQEVAGGNLHHRTTIDQADELGQLAESFNFMMGSLESAQIELQQWADTLEDQVEGKTHELEQIQHQILQVEKITSLGRLSTTAAHELNNPLASILNYSKLILRELQKSDLPKTTRKSIENDLNFIRDESKRCGEIVKNLLLFARRTGGSFRTAPVKDIIERSLMLVAHKMEMHNIELMLKIDPEDDVIVCDPALLQQAFVAILINALEAMSSGGTLTFTYRCNGSPNTVEFLIADTGSGITDEDLKHIFEPFFTTKSDQKSVGMGLSVVYGIISSHMGTIDIRRGLQGGTECVIDLPREPNLAEEQQMAEYANV